ncbi:MAG: hypothetical protein J2P16_00585 [Mycobacterium sp.]|nr:hypothetical protein [Mycobacterium sp.]
MSNEFSLNFVVFGDEAGLGAYEIGHYRQHLQYLRVLQQQGIFISDPPILHLVGDDPAELASWLGFHEALHQTLRGIARTSGGVDLGMLDPSSETQFYLWQEAHAAEHAEFNARFGTT